METRVVTKELTFVKEAETYHTGGSCMVDILTLDDGTVLVISDEGIGLYACVEHFHDEDSIPEELGQHLEHGGINGLRGMTRLGFADVGLPNTARVSTHGIEVDILTERTDEGDRLRKITRLLNEALIPATYEDQLGGGCQGISIEAVSGNWLYTDGHTDPSLGRYKEDDPPVDEETYPICQPWTVVPEELVEGIIKVINKADNEALNSEVEVEEPVVDMRLHEGYCPEDGQKGQLSSRLDRNDGQFVEYYRCRGCGHIWSEVWQQETQGETGKDLKFRLWKEDVDVDDEEFMETLVWNE